jgi:type III restriction enzyme
MATHPEFSKSPHNILNQDIRWFPADEALRESSYEKFGSTSIPVSTSIPKCDIPMAESI